MIPLMIINFFKKTILSLVLIFYLSACTKVEPYILNDFEFNRDSPSFGVQLKDRSEVGVCYNKRYTRPQIITQIAIDECRRFGKVAFFRGSKNLICSVNAPSLATYACLCPSENIQIGQEKKGQCSALK
jgi:hypothetical protein